jgi:hypothetical protein
MFLVASFTNINRGTRVAIVNIAINDTGIVFQMITRFADGAGVTIGTGVAIRGTGVTVVIEVTDVTTMAMVFGYAVIPGLASLTLIGSRTSITARDITIRDTQTIIEVVVSFTSDAVHRSGTAGAVGGTRFAATIVEIVSSFTNGTFQSAGTFFAVGGTRFTVIIVEIETVVASFAGIWRRAGLAAFHPAIGNTSFVFQMIIGLTHDARGSIRTGLTVGGTRLAAVVSEEEAWLATARVTNLRAGAGLAAIQFTVGNTSVIF